MDAGEALKLIIGYAAANRIILTPHARDRMKRRGATLQDIRHGLVNATVCHWQSEHGTWRVPSVDRDGDELTMAVALEGANVIVTLF
jgi:hypothetical protein